MASGSEARHDARVLLTVWAVLLALTIGSFWLADVRGAPGAATAIWVLGIATVKAHLIAGAYMEMVHAPRAWAVVMSGFLLLQAALLIALFSWM